jgi:hypothetical protein
MPSGLDPIQVYRALDSLDPPFAAVLPPLPALALFAPEMGTNNEAYRSE